MMGGYSEVLRSTPHSPLAVGGAARGDVVVSVGRRTAERTTTTRDDGGGGGGRKAREAVVDVAAALPSRDDGRDRAATASHGMMMVASGDIWKVRSCT